MYAPLNNLHDTGRLAVQRKSAIRTSCRFSCADPEGAGRGSGPPPPPLENVGHPLDPWKSIVFSVIKEKYVGGLKKHPDCFLAVWHEPPPPKKNPGTAT